VTSFDDVRRVVVNGTSAFGCLTVLVNNAGNAGAQPRGLTAKPFWEKDPAEWEPFLRVNLYGALNCWRAVLPGMIAAGTGGRVITVISDAGRIGEAGMEVYSAAKAGAAGLTRALARSLGRFDITANNVAIAATRTPAIASATENEELAKRILRSYIIRRFGEPHAVAAMIIFLASRRRGGSPGRPTPSTEVSVSTNEPTAGPTGSDAILTERCREHVLVIRMHRPHRRNAFDGATAHALEAVIDAYDDDDTLRCAVLTGSDIVFSSGQDLIAAAQGDRGVTKRRGGFGIMAQPPTKPIIAAVEGHALAGGLELCLSCDLIVASRTATMGIPEAARSLVAVGGGLFRLPKRIPYHLAMELALTGKAWPATRMAELGLVNKLTEPGEALSGAFDLADEILAAGPLAVLASKQIVRHAYEWTDADAWRNQLEYAKPVMASEDLQEGLRAFAEKRPAIWKGR
jgi:enoyl-CoA hydratase